MSKLRTSVEDETAISEISIAADGRVYVFGASSELLELMAVLNDRDIALQQRIAQVHTARIGPPAATIGQTDEGDCGGDLQIPRSLKSEKSL